MKKVALYLRVSTDQQTVENQRKVLEDYCRAHDWRVVRTYEDVGISGAQDSRPALDQLKANCRERKFEAVLVWKFDRMARSTMHLLQTLSLFRECRVDFISVTECVDTSTPAGTMVLSFLAAVAQFERELIKERVNAGLQRAKAEGVKIGRPRRGFDVNEALKLKGAGMTWNQIAHRLSVPSATLRRSVTPLLKNPALQPA